jgi:hypothetical protein
VIDRKIIVDKEERLTSTAKFRFLDETVSYVEFGGLDQNGEVHSNKLQVLREEGASGDF